MTEEQKAKDAYAAYLVAYAKYMDAKADAAAAETKADSAYRDFQRSRESEKKGTP